MTLVRLEPEATQSGVKHATTEQLRPTCNTTVPSLMPYKLFEEFRSLAIFDMQMRLVYLFSLHVA